MNNFGNFVAAKDREVLALRDQVQQLQSMVIELQDKHQTIAPTLNMEPTRHPYLPRRQRSRVRRFTILSQVTLETPFSKVKGN